VQANSIGEKNGQIVLYAESGGRVQSTGQLDALGTASQGGHIDIEGGFVALGGHINADGTSGGAVHVQAGTLSLADQVTARGTNGNGGTVEYDVAHKTWEISSSSTDVSGTTGGGAIRHVAGEQITTSGKYNADGGTGKGGTIDLSAWALKSLSAQFDASGDTGGGRIRLGGEYQGGKDLAVDELPNAQVLAVNDGTKIHADATGAHGDGGEVILWSDMKTAAFGDITARPGSQSGQGGSVEVSSGDTLTFGARVSAGIGERTGILLLDPKNITIADVTTSAFNPTAIILGYNYAGGNNVNMSSLGNGDLFGVSTSL
jgi:hypothetical protein